MKDNSYVCSRGVNPLNTGPVTSKIQEPIFEKKLEYSNNRVEDVCRISSNFLKNIFRTSTKYYCGCNRYRAIWKGSDIKSVRAYDFSFSG